MIIHGMDEEAARLLVKRAHGLLKERFHGCSGSFDMRDFGEETYTAFKVCHAIDNAREFEQEQK